MLMDMVFHISDDFVKKFVLPSFAAGFGNRGKSVVRAAVADQLYQKLLQINLYQLFRAERNKSFLAANQVFAGRVIQAAGVGKTGLLHDISKKRALRRADFQYPAPKKIHSGRSACKSNSNKAGGGFAFDVYAVVFAGLVENDIVFVQRMDIGTGSHVNRTLIDI